MFFFNSPFLGKKFFEFPHHRFGIASSPSQGIDGKFRIFIISFRQFSLCVFQIFLQTCFFKTIVDFSEYKYKYLLGILPLAEGRRWLSTMPGRARVSFRGKTIKSEFLMFLNKIFPNLHLIPSNSCGMALLLTSEEEDGEEGSRREEQQRQNSDSLRMIFFFIKIDCYIPNNTTKKLKCRTITLSKQKIT